MTCFGRVEVDTAPSAVVLKRRKEGEAQNLVQMSQGRHIEDINLSVDKVIAKIGLGGTCFGCDFLSDGRMILTNHRGEMIRVFNTNGSEESNIKIQRKPYDVTQVNDTTLAVSCFDMRGRGIGLKLIDMNTGKIIKSLLQGHVIFGIIAKDENHIIYCESGIGVSMIRLSDETIADIVKDSQLPDHCYVTSFGNTFIHTNTQTNTVACHDINGTMKWSFKDGNILSGPRGVTTDKYGNVFVAGLDSINLVIISADGKKHKQFGSDVTIIKSRCLDYDNKSDCLLVSNGNGECVVMKLV